MFQNIKAYIITGAMVLGFVGIVACTAVTTTPVIKPEMPTVSVPRSEYIRIVSLKYAQLVDVTDAQAKAALKKFVDAYNAKQSNEAMKIQSGYTMKHDPASGAFSISDGRFGLTVYLDDNYKVLSVGISGNNKLNLAERASISMATLGVFKDSGAVPQSVLTEANNIREKVASLGSQSADALSAIDGFMSTIDTSTVFDDELALNGVEIADPDSLPSLGSLGSVSLPSLPEVDTYDLPTLEGADVWFTPMPTLAPMEDDPWITPMPSPDVKKYDAPAAPSQGGKTWKAQGDYDAASDYVAGQQGNKLSQPDVGGPDTNVGGKVSAPTVPPAGYNPLGTADPNPPAGYHKPNK